jgi:N-acetyl-alpha-D-glucosaminyl L-malate synthase BshA
VTVFVADPNDQSLTRFTVAASDALTVPSEFLKNEAGRLLALAGEPAIEVIPNFVDTDRFAPPARRDRAHFEALFPADAGAGPVLFHVSNFRPVKHVVDLIAVLARLRRSVPARLVLVGDGPERSAAAEKARALAVEESVCFLGMRAHFAADLGHADAFLLTSASESFGVAALEALSTGVPVCGYRVGGLPEVVTAEVGRLVEPFDVEALAGAVLEVVTDSGRREALGRAARGRALACFGRDAALDRYEACFRRALEARERARRNER